MRGRRLRRVLSQPRHAGRRGAGSHEVGLDGVMHLVKVVVVAAAEDDEGRPPAGRYVVRTKLGAPLLRLFAAQEEGDLGDAGRDSADELDNCA